MIRNRTIGQQIGIGFGIVVALMLVISMVFLYVMTTVTTRKDKLVAVNVRHLILVQKLTSAAATRAASTRVYMFTGNDDWLTPMQTAGTDFTTALTELKDTSQTTEGRRIMDDIDRADGDYRKAQDQVLVAARHHVPLKQLVDLFEGTVTPIRVTLDGHVDRLARFEAQLVALRQQEAEQTAKSSLIAVVTLAGGVVAIAALIAVALTRRLGRQIGTAVGQVQSSSSELQAAANQQSMGMKEQAVAMTQITTTISELLASSRQIAESAQRVAFIAGDTSRSATVGSDTITRAHASTTGLQRQVDLIVSHMGELSRKSQQIGAILDIVSELAEQTNILAINATIEAAGAGEAGKRFGIVADEIRKLADRVGGSTKDIRRLIEDVRQAVGMTVMTTESGSKLADESAQRFEEFNEVFQQIADQVARTTEAAREIELSTKQQTTAVEQVNIAVANVAQGTRETEASSGQTLKTASELAGLSRDLLSIVRRGA